MKKAYETPVIEKVSFCYSDQVVASGGGGCLSVWVNAGPNSCIEGNSHLEYLN